MGRDNQAAVTKSVLHKVTVVALTVYVDADTHTHIHVPPQRIIMKKVTNRADADTHTHAYTLAKYLQSANGCSA
jgi:hypothetical protein